MEEDEGRGLTAAPEIATVPDAEPEVGTAGPDQLRKADLVASVAATTGLRKADVRSVIEAAFAEVGAALEEGRDVSVPELGKLKVNREKTVDSSKILICKLRRPKKSES